MQYISSGKLFFTSVRYDFYHEAVGSLRLCSTTSFSKNKLTTIKFKPRDTVWSRAKAMVGILEKITIKTVLFSSVTIMYKDTYNTLWNENELVDETDATALAIAYWEYVQAKIEAYQESVRIKC